MKTLLGGGVIPWNLINIWWWCYNYTGSYEM